jgi:hypothetical protein
MRIAYQPQSRSFCSWVTGPIGCHPCVTATVTPILLIRNNNKGGHFRVTKVTLINATGSYERKGTMSTMQCIASGETHT